MTLLELGMQEDPRKDKHRGNGHSITQHYTQNRRVLVGLHNQAIGFRIDESNDQVLPPRRLLLNVCTQLLRATASCSSSGEQA